MRQVVRRWFTPPATARGNLSGRSGRFSRSPATPPGLGRTVFGEPGALELRGIMHNDRLLFASVLNEGVAA